MNSKTLNDILDKFTEIIGLGKKDLKKEFRVIITEVDFLIKTKSKNINRIETALDKLLDLSYHDVGGRLFYRLIAYYRLVDRDNAEYYRDYYDSINK